MSEITKTSWLPRNAIHEAIERNDFDLLMVSISPKNNNIDQANESGDTPLMRCLRLNRSDRFIILLLSCNCNLKIPDQHGKTALYAALDNRRFYIAHKLIEYGATLDDSANLINSYMYEALKNRDYMLLFFLTRYKPHAVEIFLKTQSLTAANTEDLPSTVVNLLVDLDRKLSEHPYMRKFNYVGANLIQYVMDIGNSDMFKMVWTKLNHECIHECFPQFIKRFLLSSNFSNSGFMECLDLVIASPQIKLFLKIYHNCHISHSYYTDLIKACAIRDLDPKIRLKTIEKNSLRIDVTIFDICSAHYVYGVKADTLTLIYFLDREKLMSNTNEHKQTLQYLKCMENHLALTENDKKGIGLLARYGYSASPNWFDKTLHENVCLKPTSVTHGVPSLLELSNSVAQKHVQTVYNNRNPEQFQRCVDNLVMPNVVKKTMCFRIPISYNNRS